MTNKFLMAILATCCMLSLHAQNDTASFEYLKEKYSIKAVGNGQSTNRNVNDHNTSDRFSSPAAEVGDALYTLIFQAISEQVYLVEANGVEYIGVASNTGVHTFPEGDVNVDLLTNFNEDIIRLASPSSKYDNSSGLLSIFPENHQSKFKIAVNPGADNIIFVRYREPSKSVLIWEKLDWVNGQSKLSGEVDIRKDYLGLVVFGVQESNGTLQFSPIGLMSGPGDLIRRIPHSLPPTDRGMNEEKDKKKPSKNPKTKKKKKRRRR